MGHLTGLEMILPRRHVEWLPYATTRVERDGTAAPVDPFHHDGQLLGGTGLDVKWLMMIGGNR